MCRYNVLCQKQLRVYLVYRRPSNSIGSKEVKTKVYTNLPSYLLMKSEKL